MRKFLTALLVVCMIAALSVSACAYDVPQSPVTNVSTDQGEIHQLDPDSEAAKDWTGVESVSDFAAAEGLTGLKDADKLTYSSAFDFTPNADVANGTAVTFTDANIKAGKRVVVLHFVNGAWKVELDTVATVDGQVSFQFQSNSPYAILVESASTTPAEQGGNGSTTTTTKTGTTQPSAKTGTAQAGAKTSVSGETSAKTGDVSYELYLLAGMMLFGAVAVVALKRREA